VIQCTSMPKKQKTELEIFVDSIIKKYGDRPEVIERFIKIFNSFENEHSD